MFFSYGFCIPDNKYDSFIFRVKLNVNITAEEDHSDYSLLMPDPDNEDDVLCAEEIRLKFDQLNQVLLGYLRTIFRTYYQHKLISDNFSNYHQVAKENGGSGLLLTKPKSIDYEIFIFKRYLGLMEFLKYQKEKNASLEQDLLLLA